MKRELNKNEFYICSKGMKDAMDLLNGGHPKSALSVLKPVRKLLERDGISTRMLALALVLMGDCYAMLDDNANQSDCYLKGQAAAKAIRDEALQHSIDEKLQAMVPWH